MIVGWIDTSAGYPAKLPGQTAIDSAAGAKQLVLPGAEIKVSGTGADLAFARGVVVACEGAPRFRDDEARRAAAAQGTAAGWLALFARHGTNGLARVADRFSVVYIDLHRRAGFLACDRFAIHSLCYTLQGGRIAFADRADTVPADEAPAIDLQALYDYLYFHVIPAPRTIFRGVARLQAASMAAFDAKGLRVEPYWLPSFAEQPAGSLDELKATFRALVHDAVAREIDGVKVGAFLSGGTDSSTLSGMLGKVTGRPAPTYSIGFDAEGYDEMSYARITSRHFGTEHHEYYITPDDVVRGIPEIARYYDQPFGNSSALPAYYCARLAKADGVAKLLGGDGGDELFGGNARYAKQRVFDVYHRLPAGLRSAIIEPILVRCDWPRAVPVLRKAASYVQQARIPMPDRMNSYNLLERLGTREVLDDGFLRAVDVQDPARQQRAIYSRVNASLVNAMLAFDWKYTLADNDLPKVCQTASLAGVVVGFPLLTDEIVDFSLRLTSSLKVHGLQLRYFFKEALKGFLPEATINKQKHGFGLPFGHWALSHKPLNELARASLASLARRGFVQPRFLDELLTRKVPEQPGYFGEMVWILMMMEQWLEHRTPQFSVADARR